MIQAIHIAKKIPVEILEVWGDKVFVQAKEKVFRYEAAREDPEAPGKIVQSERAIVDKKHLKAILMDAAPKVIVKEKDHIYAIYAFYGKNRYARARIAILSGARPFGIFDGAVLVYVSF